MTGKAKQGQSELQQPSSLEQRLAANIQARRRMLKLTQAALAERLGVDTETLSRFERAKHLPSLTTLERLAGILETTASELLAAQAEPVAEDATMLSVWMAQLGDEDRAFVRDLVKFQCEHLTHRANKREKPPTRRPGAQPRKKKSST